MKTRTTQLDRLIARHTWYSNPITARCISCQGTGTVFGDRTCRNCAGTGTRTSSDLLAARDDQFASDLIRTYNLDWDCLTPITTAINTLRTTGAINETPIDGYTDGYLTLVYNEARDNGVSLPTAIARYVQGTQQ